jgi:hypothetical protein
LFEYIELRYNLALEVLALVEKEKQMLNFKLVSIQNFPVIKSSPELNAFQNIEQALDRLSLMNVIPNFYNNGLQPGYYYPNPTWPTIR